MLPSTAWHPEFEDVNNDGFVDLFVSKGNVEAQSGYATRDPSNLLIGQADGTFVEGAEAAGIVGFDRARGAALVDLNLDGMLDLVVVNRARARNAVAQRRQRRRRAAGADGPLDRGPARTSRLRTSTPSVRGSRCGSETAPSSGRSPSEVGTPAASSAGSTLGLGDADRAEVRVQWPDGEIGPWMTIGADQFVTIERGRRGDRLAASAVAFAGGD